MNLSRNKRLLTEACHANGIDIKEGDTPAAMYGMLLQSKVRRVESSAPAASKLMASNVVALQETSTSNVPDEDVYLATEKARIKEQYPAFDDKAAEAEAAARWKMICKSFLKGDELKIEKALVSEIEQQLADDAWTLVLKGREAYYYRQDPNKKRQAEREKQDAAYDISLVADHIKKEKEDEREASEIGKTRVRPDGRIEICKSRQIIRNGVPCKGVELYWELQPEVDEKKKTDPTLGDAPQMTTSESLPDATDMPPSGVTVPTEHAKAEDIITHREAREKITNVLMCLSHVDGGSEALCELLRKMDDEQANDPDKKTTLIGNPRVMASKIAYTLTSNFSDRLKETPDE